jgi:hypothetical protein
MSKPFGVGDFVVAILCGFGGMFFGALGLGVLATELSQSTREAEATAAFNTGFLAGAALGATLGVVAFVWLRRRRDRPIVRKELAPDDARRRFEWRMKIRYTGFGAIAAGFVYMQLARDGQRMSEQSFRFGGLILAGALVYAFASRCPACARFFDVRSIRERRCSKCDTSFNTTA